MTPRAAIYARVSTDDQRERQTIEVQLKDAREYCVRMGWEVAEEFLDDGISGAKPLAERPAGALLLEALALPKKDRPFEHVVLCYVDRLGRDNETAVPAYNKLLRLLGGNVHFVFQSFDDTIDGQFQFNIFMSVAQWERGKIRQRSMKGISAKVREGKMYRATNPSYGYRYNADTKQMEIHEAHAATVRRIYELYLSGNGEKRICNALGLAGVARPADETEGKRANTMGVWHKSVIRRILTSRVYLGEGTFHASDPDRLTGGKVEVLSMECPAIIDRGTFARAQEIRRRRGSDGPRSKRQYMLQGLVFCGICDARYSVEVSNHGRQVYYVCSQRARYSTPGHPVVEAHAGHRHHWSAIKLEAVTKAFIRRFMADPSFLTTHVERRLSGLAERYNEQAGEVHSLEQRLARAEAEEQGVLEQGAKGCYKDDAQMLAALEKVRKEQDALRRKLSKAQVAATSTTEIRDHLLSMRDALLRLWSADKNAVSDVIQWREPETDDDWRSLIRYLVDRIIVTGQGKKLGIRFEGLLVIPTPGMAASKNAPDMGISLGDSPPKSKALYQYGFASAARL